MPSIGQMVKIPIIDKLKDLHLLKMDETAKVQLGEELIERFNQTLVPALKKVESRFEKSFPFKEIENKVRQLDVDKHKSLLWSTFRGMRESEVLTGGRVEVPVCSFEELDNVKTKVSYETPKATGIRFNSGFMWSREANEYSLYLDYIITHIRTLEDFEWLESHLPDASYFDIYVPMKLHDKELVCSLLDSWQQLSEATKRYQLYELVNLEESKYSVLLRIDDVHLTLDLNLRTKQIHLRKHMYQGKSMPPTRVLEKIERNDELVVLTSRIPMWLKQKLEKEAEQKKEQLGTYLRKVLEEKYG